MSTPFGLVAACEAKNVEPGTSRLWASIRVEPRGKAMENDRAPLAIALVIDTSGSMQGDPIAHVIQSCGIVADLLTDRDQLAIVTFSTFAMTIHELSPMDDAGKRVVKGELARVTVNGSTNMEDGIARGANALAPAPAGMRRVMVVMSDGKPNCGGATTAEQLAAHTRMLRSQHRFAVSSLGFGLHHDEKILDAVAVAGSGRYTYVPDPLLARVDLARAALAHGGIVADQLELRLAPAEGVELVQVLPSAPLRHGKHGVAMAIGDVFVDEGRSLAVELQLDLRAGATGRLAELEVVGRAPDGTMHTTTATLDVDVRAGARVIDRDAQRAILLVQADEARAQAHAQADRRALPAAAAILRGLANRIDALDGFVRNDGSPIAELREQLEDEIANYERKGNDLELVHQRKQSMAYKSATPTYQRAARVLAPVQAMLVGIGGPVAGQRFMLLTEMVIGRSTSNDLPVASSNLSRQHARVMFVDGGFLLHDLGSTNGSKINGATVTSAPLAHGDLVELGDAVFRFQLV